MTGGARWHFPAVRWLAAAGRALLFAAILFVLQDLIRVGLAPVAPVGAQASLAVHTALILVAALATGALLLRLLDDRPAAAQGIALSAAVPRELGIGALAGTLPQLAVAGGLLLAGGLGFTAAAGSAGEWWSSIGSALLVLAVAAAAEEAVYRGYGFQVLVAGIGRWPTLLLTSGFFALAHAQNPAVTPFALGNIFLAGVVLGLAYLRTLSLWLVTALHTAWNWSMASLLDLPVSGLGLFDTPAYEPVLTAPAWLAGGEFGPEGGLLGTAALLLALLIVSWWPNLAPSPAQLAARPLPATAEAKSA